MLGSFGFGGPNQLCNLAQVDFLGGRYRLLVHFAGMIDRVENRALVDKADLDLRGMDIYVHKAEIQSMLSTQAGNLPT